MSRLLFVFWRGVKWVDLSQSALKRRGHKTYCNLSLLYTPQYLPLLIWSMNYLDLSRVDRLPAHGPQSQVPRTYPPHPRQPRIPKNHPGLWLLRGVLKEIRELTSLENVHRFVRLHTHDRCCWGVNFQSPRRPITQHQNPWRHSSPSQSPIGTLKRSRIRSALEWPWRCGSWIQVKSKRSRFSFRCSNNIIT